MAFMENFSYTVVTDIQKFKLKVPGNVLFNGQKGG